ncbi:hypothetical protein [Roseobacter sp.]|uniref:hypothetical protein n=1 Tax=Roseobacter sp. TaxID=1907202 RepID=UPI0029672006|nr:hypothetical protein [Roseobacter sp.]MDW3181645.1 hypothetical protein [Roseobacter sp.]
MKQSFLQTFMANMETRPAGTSIFAALHVAVALFLGAVLDDALEAGITGLIAAFAGVIFASTKVSKFDWFWKGEQGGPAQHDVPVDNNQMAMAAEATNTPDVKAVSGLPAHSESVSIREGVQGPRLTVRYEKIRETPVGTSIIQISDEKAVLEVQSVIQFWCWFAPLTLTVLAFVAIPVGAWLGYVFYEATITQGWQFNSRDAVGASLRGAIILPALALGAAFLSYRHYRPQVRVTITPDMIQYGDRKFDRQYSGGVRIGYYSQEAELGTSFTQGRFGVTLMRLSYGRWGEDLKYMVSSYHAPEIVVWMNEIIDGVGEQITPRHDPYAGKKIELL